jgi:peroxiredoxin Q/BCP
MANPPDIGALAPHFALQGWFDDSERVFALSAGLGHPVVLAFYPGDDTPTCTKQLCSYSDNLSILTGLGAEVWGISAQDIASHAAFAAKRGLKLPLLADTDKAVAKAYGVTGVLGVKRATFVIDADGKVAWRHVAPVGLTYKSIEEISAVIAGLPTPVTPTSSTTGGDTEVPPPAARKSRPKAQDSSL